VGRKLRNLPAVVPHAPDATVPQPAADPIAAGSAPAREARIAIGERETGVADIERKRLAFVVLREALARPLAERAAWIEQRCGGDRRLAADVAAMLEGDDGHGRLLSGGDPLEVASRLVGDDDDDLRGGERLGDWRIVRRLGAGGMGTVYLAQRDGDGYVQRGALKLIRRGMDSIELLARFRRERQILSRLDHPSIARLLDGGIAADGRPFLVMEHVDGETLAAWAQRTGAGLTARIALFLRLCDAVAHAHRQLIVHRDIKPGNVLVDAAGQPRLLDFGIAKVLEQTGPDDRTSGARYVSRAYAAPEQAGDGPVTTATDIYQLGLLLWELLTGVRLQPGTAGAGGARPAQALAAARQQAGSAGPAAIAPAQLRGDAGIILARATDPDPLRRYATVEAFADDLRHWQAGRPILARADAVGYRLRRFVFRHRLPVALAAIAVLALILGSGVALWQARRAEGEAQLARAAQAFLGSLFEASAPDIAAGERLTARELLDRGAARLGTELASQPRLRAEMLLTLGTVYRQLGQFDQAQALLTEAEDLVATGGAAPDRDARLLAELGLAIVERHRDQLDAADARLSALLRGTLDDGQRALALSERAQVRERQGGFDEALADARAAAAIDRARGAAGSADLARDRQVEALVLTRLGRLDEAVAAAQEAIALATARYGDADTRVAQMYNDFGVALTSKSQPAQAEVALRKALAIRRARLGEAHPAIAETLQVLGGALRQLGRLDEARASLLQALAIQRESLGAVHGDTAQTLNSLAILEMTVQNYAPAETHLREALAIQQAMGLEQTAVAATMTTSLGAALMRMGRYEEAGSQLRAALGVHRQVLGDAHPAVMNTHHSLAQLAIRQDDGAAAIVHARAAVAIADSAFGPSRETALSHATLAAALLLAGDPSAALATAAAAQAMFEQAGGADDPRVLHAVTIQARALLALGRADDARPLAERALRDTPAEQLASVAGAHALLGRIARAQGRAGEADRAQASALATLAQLPAPEPALVRDVRGD
jgi:serine/threonine-protein kinase